MYKSVLVLVALVMVSSSGVAQEPLPRRSELPVPP